ncbi:UNVERIFIED_CONTAM: Chaperone protein dnaJ 49 [Sesamum latifolium]|uniref:Chaperone protein dnaJ 49 n=1 Tax=Sesamum latifolium TaxID=2727402 RepID=A0AAW2VBN2_9LAMI
MRLSMWLQNLTTQDIWFEQEHFQFYLSCVHGKFHCLISYTYILAMDCNKDEAIRARQIAENKMENNDFEGARKVALKAQSLYPELENIAQLLSICDVHCSAQKRMLGSEKDWYAILQVESLADESTVKKQYRRLALFLHPDKNRFPGAEAAFKLICEANAVLSDPTKKSLYDSKIRVSVRSSFVNPPPHHMNRSSQLYKQYGAQNTVPVGLSSLNQRQATQPSISIRQEVFWTSCPFCSIKYQYPRKLVNTTLRCLKCLKNFTAYEISAQGVASGSNWAPHAQQVPAKPGVSQSAAFQRVPTQGNFTTGVQNVKGSSASYVGSQQNANRRTVHPEPGARTGSVYRGVRLESGTNISQHLKAKGSDGCKVNSWQGGKEGRACNGDANNRGTGNLKNKSRKRGRKLVVESSDSCDSTSESDLEDVTIKDNFRDPATDLNSGASRVHLRRSSRKRHHVSYNEGDDDDDHLPGPLKRPQANKSSEDNGNERTTSESNKMGTVKPEESLQDKDAYCDKEVKARGKGSGMSGIHADTIEIKSDSDRDSYSSNNLGKDICDCGDPEFSDFDKNRNESCFAVNQFWACYDSVDGMPRFYAKVRKVCASPFELSITWLEPDPMDEAYGKWISGVLPVGCGSFKLGKTEKTSLLLTFSHQVNFGKGKKRGSFSIYPRKGEVWALFKDWDLSWSTNPENHKEYKYELVEVLSDFVAVSGIRVCYLDKVRGFLSLFQRSRHSETDSFLIGSSELLKFSHRVPCFKMTGAEREGVPVGSFELDPASLPLNPDDLYYPGKEKMETKKNMDPKVDRPPPKSAIKKGNFVKYESSSSGPKEFVDLEGTGRCPISGDFQRTKVYQARHK